MPLTVGALVAVLVLIDNLLAPFFMPGWNFVWIAFASWTVFYGASLKERFTVIPSYIIGFLSANLMIWLGGCFGISNIFIVAIASLLVNALVVYLDLVKFLTVSGMFVGIFITFSRGGVGLQTWSWKMFLLMMIYGIFGLICGWVCSEMQSKYIDEK